MNSDIVYTVYTYINVTEVLCFIIFSDNEIFNKRLRAILGSSTWQNVYSLGVCVTAWIGYMIRDHIVLQLSITLPMLLYVLLFAYVYDGLRYTLTMLYTASHAGLVYYIFRDSHNVYPNQEKTPFVDTTVVVP